MPLGYIGIGSNLGGREANIRRALRLLEEKGVKVKKVATFITTKPYGVTDQPDFLNTAAAVEFPGTAEELLDIMLGIELEMGRKRLRHWGERNIDLDLLLYGDEVIQTQKLTLPHPDMANRKFVLEPLAEIAGGVRHPVLQKTIGELLANLLKGEKVNE